MALTLDKWVETHVKKFEGIKPEKIYNELFFRDEFRQCFYDSNLMYAPADGLVIYQKKVKPNEKIIEVKGINYTVSDIMNNKNLPDINYYVVGVFMTLYDVHINRMPTDGLLKYNMLPNIKSRNLPMIFMEKDIFKGKLNFKNSDYNYLFSNERCLNTIYYNKMRLKYHIIQIADIDVSVITPYSIENPSFYCQNERFSFIRWGSQCDLIIPEVPGYEFEFMQKDYNHVQAGIDPLIKIVRT